MARERDEPFRQALRELGYVEGKNIVIEYRFAEGKFDRLSDLAAELVELKVDLIVANVTQASLAAKGATRTVPIVMQGVSDPIGTGLVASLARPGANITGTSAMSAIGPWLNEPRFNRYDALADLGAKNTENFDGWQVIVRLLCPSTNLKIFQRNSSRQSIRRPTAVWSLALRSKSDCYDTRLVKEQSNIPTHPSRLSSFFVGSAVSRLTASRRLLAAAWQHLFLPILRTR